MYNLGVDLGGTNIAVGVVNENYEIIGRGKMKTRAPRPAEEIVADIVAACEMAVKDAGITMADIASVGIGSPGSVDPKTGIIATSNNLRFNNVPMTDMVSKGLGGIKCYIDNDANAAAYGEFTAGAGKGTRDFVTITLGTGVGCGIIIDEKLFTGYNNAGGELGHTVIVFNGEQCNCGRKGCWETYASATALIRQTKDEMVKDTDSIMWELVDNDQSKVSGRTAFEAMRKGDRAAKRVVDQYISYVACGAANVVNTFQPEVLCIGGGIANEGESLIAPIRKIIEFERYSKNVEKQTDIRKAQLGNDAGIIGAACLYKLR